MDTRPTKRARDDDSINSEKEAVNPKSWDKTKPCARFFSYGGCSYGNQCNYKHEVQGGVHSVRQIAPLLATVLASSNKLDEQNFCQGYKTVLCVYHQKGNPPCSFGSRCSFAHGETELRKVTVPSQAENRNRNTNPGSGNCTRTNMHRSSFEGSSMPKLCIQTCYASFVIGKGGTNIKSIFASTEAKIHVRDHETNAELKNVYFEGTDEQVKQAMSMVDRLIHNVKYRNRIAVGEGRTETVTEVCRHYLKGGCAFGDRCRYTHHC